MIQYGFFFRSFPFFSWISRYFTTYTFQTIMVYNVFQIPFKLNGSIRGLLFSIIWDIECCLLVSFNTAMIRKSRWLPFRLSDYKTRQFPKISHYVRRILYTIHSWHAILMGIYHDETVMSSTGYFATSCTLPMPNFQELNSKSEIVFNIANP